RSCGAVIDAGRRRKLRTGAPTTILSSAAVSLPAKETPVATTVQSCKVTWHVWEEAYRIDLTQPGTQNTTWTTTVDGVLRRCADARQLLIASRLQAPPGQPAYRSEEHTSELQSRQ